MLGSSPEMWPGTLQVSKWVKLHLLIDDQEMAHLLQSLSPFKIYDVQKITDYQEGISSPSQFLEQYSHYIAHLKKCEMSALIRFRSFFSAAWSVHEDPFISIPTEGNKRLLKATLPIVQTQFNQIRYSPDEKVFRTQVYGLDTIYWGIQIGFPHLYLNPISCEAVSTRDFPNMALFLTIQKWVRQHTLPTPFIVQGKKINSPIRLGKMCFSWIHVHPQLITNGISIVYPNNMKNWIWADAKTPAIARS